jgi:hypothetical protein
MKLPRGVSGDEPSARYAAFVLRNSAKQVHTAHSPGGSIEQALILVEEFAAEL